MVNYQNAKIYKLYTLLGDEVYIGSTYEILCKRIAKHRCDYKRYKEGKYHFISSFILFDMYGVENVKIELIRNCPCDNKEELHREEGSEIRIYKDNCVNKCVAGRTLKEYYESNKEEILEKQKEYYETNKEYAKKYYETNKEEILQYAKEWRENNKDYHKIYGKEYYEDNKEKMKEKIVCECGSELTRINISRHRKTKKHLKYEECINK